MTDQIYETFLELYRLLIIRSLFLLNNIKDF